MGLTIYFCDVCGIRITDVDLRAGHGMLRGYDAICGSCIDLGHGKSWLAARAAEPLAVGATVGADASLAVGNGTPKRTSGRTEAAVSLVDHARDRAATIEDDVEDQKPSVRMETPRPQLNDESRAVGTLQPDLASAVSGFAALSASPARSSHADDADGALEVESSDEVDPSLLTETAETMVDDVANDESSALVRARGAKAKTASSSRIKAAKSAPAASSSTRRSSSSSSVDKKSASSKISKSKTGRSSRKSASSKPGIPLPLLITLITVPLILLLGIGVGVAKLGHSKKADVKDLPAQRQMMIDAVNQARAQARNAIGTGDLSKLQAAQTSLQDMQQTFENFSANAKKYSGWTEQNCEDFWEGLHGQDVNALSKNIRDEISRTRGGQH